MDCLSSRLEGSQCIDATHTHPPHFPMAWPAAVNLGVLHLSAFSKQTVGRAL